VHRQYGQGERHASHDQQTQVTAGRHRRALRCEHVRAHETGACGGVRTPLAHAQALAIRHLLSMVNKIDDDEERRTLQAACHTALIHMHCE